MLSKLYFLIILSVFILSANAKCETFELQTSYPAPYGSYEKVKSGQVHLAPKTAEPQTCDEANYGALYFDKGQDCLVLCNSNGWNCIGDTMPPLNVSIEALTTSSNIARFKNYNTVSNGTMETKVTATSNNATPYYISGLAAGATVDFTKYVGKSVKISLIGSLKLSNNNQAPATIKVIFGGSEIGSAQVFDINYDKIRTPYQCYLVDTVSAGPVQNLAAFNGSHTELSGLYMENINYTNRKRLELNTLGYPYTGISKLKTSVNFTHNGSTCGTFAHNYTFNETYARIETADWSDNPAPGCHGSASIPVYATTTISPGSLQNANYTYNPNAVDCYTIQTFNVQLPSWTASSGSVNIYPVLDKKPTSSTLPPPIVVIENLEIRLTTN